MNYVIGENVPWNAAWSGEEKFEVRPCRYADGKLAMWQQTAPGVGKPMFAAPHLVRQRASIAKMLCTVCGKHTPPDDRWFFPELAEKVEHPSGNFLATTEAPVHAECAELAQARCPHIRQRELRPTRFLGAYSIIAALVAGEAVERDFGLRIPTDRPVIGHLKIVIAAKPAG